MKCVVCSNPIRTLKHHLKRPPRFCSRQCIGISRRKWILLTCEECHVPFLTKRCFSDARFCSKTCAGRQNTGARNGRWIEDRSTLAQKQIRNDPAYKEWRREVWLRDNFACKIANPDCSGRIEAHHILGWAEYPELRYQSNNGITLCHAHHPFKKAEEKRLSPYFQSLVSVSKD